MYPGSFDPVHLGHVDIAHRAAAMFDRLIVAVYDRSSKPLTFTPEERIDLFRQAMHGATNVEVTGYHGLTIHFARERGAAFVIRGLRANADFDYEAQMTSMNRHLEPELDTVFLLTSLRHAFLSSSLIKEVAAQGASLDGLVPDLVADALRARFQNER